MHIIRELAILTNHHTFTAEEGPIKGFAISTTVTLENSPIKPHVNKCFFPAQNITAKDCKTISKCFTSEMCNLEGGGVHKKYELILRGCSGSRVCNSTHFVMDQRILCNCATNFLKFYKLFYMKERKKCLRFLI